MADEATSSNPSDGDTLEALQSGRVVGGQRVPWSSNGTFVVKIEAGPQRVIRGVYKPKRGERPLYDFPSGSLYKREYAAYLVSRALGWPNIPPTVIRDGPHGVGSMQLYVESDPRVTYFDLIERNVDKLLPFAAFDLLCNNADRKGGHCLLGSDGRIWSIDHGLTFHRAFKLRTVMLEFWGVAIPGRLTDDLAALRGHLETKSGLGGAVAELLTDSEMDALLQRLDVILKDPVIPNLHPGVNVPWPLV